MLKAFIKYIASSTYYPFCGRGEKVVLCYHSLKSKSVDNFRRQMEYLVNHFRVVKPSTILAAKSDGETIVAITFDDAYISFYENAIDILRGLNIPAGVFVPTGFMGQPCSWKMPAGHPDISEKVIDYQRISELRKYGIEVFSHTVTHQNLTRLSENELKRELSCSKSALENILGHSVNTISYPHGKYDNRVLCCTAAEGYELGFTIDPKCVKDSSDSLAIGRFIVSPDDSLSVFRLKASGAYNAVNFLRSLKQ